MRRRQLQLAHCTIGLAGALVLASCGGASEITSATVAPTVATTQPPATTAPPTTTAPTPVTDPPPTTAPAPTTAPPTTEPPPTTAPEASPVAPPETAFISADGQLLEVSVATGDTVRVVVDEFEGDGVFRSVIRLMPDRESLWFAEGYEDGWFSCESSEGSFGRVDLTTGELSPGESGTYPEPSANGIALATIASDHCIPDPENEEFWVLTPYDRVVIYLIADGDSREFVTDTPPDGYDAPSSVQWAGFSTGGNLLVVTGDGQMRNVDISGSSVIQDHPVVLSEVLGFPVAATADALITVALGDEGSTDLYSTDALSGDVTFLASSETFMTVGVSLDEHIIVASSTEVTVAPGAEVTVLPLGADDPFVFDIDW